MNHDIRSHLMSLLSHDLRGTLPTLKVELDFIRTWVSEREAEQNDGVADVLDAAANMARVLERLEFITRPMDAMSSSYCIPVEVVEIAYYLSRSERKNIALSVVDETDRLVAVVGQIPVLHCLLNCFVNAYEARRGDQGLQIDVAVRCAEDRILIIVSDNGLGLAPEVARELGYAAVTTKGPGRGTSVLAAASALRSVGGDISFGTNTRGGTDVTIKLPGFRRAPVEGSGAPGLK